MGPESPKKSLAKASKTNKICEYIHLASFADSIGQPVTCYLVAISLIDG